MLVDEALLHIGALAVLLAAANAQMRQFDVADVKFKQGLDQLRMEIQALVLSLDIPVETESSTGQRFLHPWFNNLRMQLLLYVADMPVYRSPFLRIPFFFYRESYFPLFWYFRRGLDVSVSNLVFAGSGLLFAVIVAGTIWDIPLEYGGRFAVPFAYWTFAATILIVFIHVVVPSRLHRMPLLIRRLAEEMRYEVEVALQRQAELTREQVSVALSKIAITDLQADREGAVVAPRSRE
jgi:hypothetical protein